MRRPLSGVGGVIVSTDEAREVYEAQREELCSLSVPPARELRDLHKDLWIRFGKEETSTIRRLSSVQERLKQQQESLAELEQLQSVSGPAHPVKVEKVKYLTREIQSSIRKTKAWNTGQLDGLERNQNTLEEELEVLERTLSKAKIEQEIAEKAAEAEQEAIANKEQEAVVDDPPEEFQEDFHIWLARVGGHNGGWTQDDHLFMTTLTHRHANWRRKPDRFIDEVWAWVKAVPSKEVVKKHVDWYAEYCARRDKQKEKIGQWKKSKIDSKVVDRKQSP